MSGYCQPWAALLKPGGRSRDGGYDARARLPSAVPPLRIKRPPRIAGVVDGTSSERAVVSQVHWTSMQCRPFAGSGINTTDPVRLLVTIEFESKLEAYAPLRTQQLSTQENSNRSKALRAYAKAFGARLAPIQLYDVAADPRSLAARWRTADPARGLPSHEV